MKKNRKTIRKQNVNKGGKLNRKSRKNGKKQKGSGVKTHDIHKVKVMYFSRGKEGEKKPGDFVMIHEDEDEIADINIQKDKKNGSTYYEENNKKVVPSSIFSKMKNELISVDSFIEDIVEEYNGKQSAKKYPKIIETVTFRSDAPYKEIKTNLKKNEQKI